MGEIVCRYCRGQAGNVVLDLGEQPASDHFPLREDPGPDPLYPLQMWLCAGCRLAQLAADSTVPEEPKGAQPAALFAQAADAVDTLASAGLMRRGQRVVEYGSPHGGSWLRLLADRGLVAAADSEPVDVVLDCFGIMHCADQAAALSERAERVAPAGVLLLQYHALATIIRRGQWNALRHGHFAYYSVSALTRMLAGVGFVPRAAWRFSLYGGTVLLAATRTAPDSDDRIVEALLAEERELRVVDPSAYGNLQRQVNDSGEAVCRWLAAQRATGRSVLGYGAASRAVALLCQAGIDDALLPAVADASASKQGRRMPGTRIPVIAPEDLVLARPDDVLVFLPELLDEVRRTLPVVEATGGRWVDVEQVTRGSMG